jgi:putative membrane protein
MRRFLSTTTMALLALGLAAAAPSSRAHAQGEASPAARAVTFPDADFALKAGQSNAEEAALGDLARRRASNPDVKRFGRHMVTDHLEAGRELLAIATRKGIPVPRRALEKLVRTERAILAARPGQRFDLEYIKQQVASHRVALTLFRHAAQNADDPAIKAYAQKYRPVIQEHLNEAEALLRRLTPAPTSAQ